MYWDEEVTGPSLAFKDTVNAIVAHAGAGCFNSTRFEIVLETEGNACDDEDLSLMVYPPLVFFQPTIIRAEDIDDPIPKLAHAPEECMVIKIFPPSPGSP